MLDSEVVYFSARCAMMYLNFSRRFLISMYSSYISTNFQSLILMPEFDIIFSASVLIFTNSATFIVQKFG